MEKFDLQKLAGGSVSEQINMEIQKVFDNIYDPNTSETKERKLTITIKFVPSKNDREIVDVEVISKAMLQPVNGVSTRFIIDMDDTGKVIANEWAKGRMIGQLEIEEDYNNEESDFEVDLDGIIDFQSKAK